MPDSNQTPSTGRSDFELPDNTPASVRRWHAIHVKEGVPTRLAFYRAIERAAADGEISEVFADRLEELLRGNNGHLDLG